MPQSNPPRGAPSPFNHFLDPSPDQLLRVAIGYGFRRGRLKAVYNLLRGKEIDSEGQTGSERNFAILAAAQAKVIDLSNWHQFLQCVMLAGFRSGKLITAQNTLLYGYVLFLLGKIDYRVPLPQLRVLIARWIFMSAVTSRYSGSYESTIEADLLRFRTASDGAEFAETLERIIGETLTEDFWTIRLPSKLETTAARGPALYSYYAALNLLNARVLFSPMSVRELLDPSVRGDRLAIERHHLFPAAHLKRVGYDTSRDIDQIANFALLEWPDNAKISDTDPKVYAPTLMNALPPAEQQRMSHWHALPPNWCEMPYPEFLAARRSKMARVVREGFEAIGRPSAVADVTPADQAAERTSSVEELIARGESSVVEFKSSARWSINDARVHDGVELAIVKTLAGFMNSAGGTLLIGVRDDGTVFGLEADYATLQKKNRDGFELWFGDLVQTMIGKTALALLAIDFEVSQGRDVARVHARRSPRIVFVNPPKEPRTDDVYVRFGNSTRKLTPAEVIRYHEDWGASQRSAPAELTPQTSGGFEASDAE